MGEAYAINNTVNLSALASAHTAALTVETANWYAIKVRARAESTVSGLLRIRGLNPYCPMQKERRRYSDRMKVVETAVFPGYIFCRFDANKKLLIISTPGVECIVSVAGAPMAIPEQEMEHVRRAIEAGACAAPYFKEGQRVRVTHGPLSGVEGIVTREAGCDRLVISIELLSRSVSLHIDSDMMCSLSAH
jgi:transcription antitermination factor NusG